MLPYTVIIHEKLSTVLTFAYSYAHLHDVLINRFKGDREYLSKTIHKIAHDTAIRAFIELTSFLRLLDDKDDLSGYFEQTGAPPLGLVTKQDGSREPLYLRDLTNNIMHAKVWNWDVSVQTRPKLICISNNPERWLTAEIDIEAFAAFCQLMH